MTAMRPCMVRVTAASHRCFRGVVVLAMSLRRLNLGEGTLRGGLVQQGCGPEGVPPRPKSVISLWMHGGPYGVPGAFVRISRSGLILGTTCCGKHNWIREDPTLALTSV